MEDLVVVNAHEQEYLLRTIESALHVRQRRQLFLWTQGQFQVLLPHEIMVCIQFGANDEVLHIEHLHRVVLDDATLEYLCNPRDGLAVRLAHYCSETQRLPCIVERGDHEDFHPLAGFSAELKKRKLGSAVVHGTGPVLGGSSVFALFCLPAPSNQRQSLFFELLLPHLHIAWLRIIFAGDGKHPKSASAGAQNKFGIVTKRELEILYWVKEGKSNNEIGSILNISTLTVKNHVQKIYKKLNVQNRVQAVSRCIALRLLDSSAH